VHALFGGGAVPWETGKTATQTCISIHRVLGAVAHCRTRKASGIDVVSLCVSLGYSTLLAFIYKSNPLPELPSEDALVKLTR
jgi:hypothetical protein